MLGPANRLFVAVGETLRRPRRLLLPVLKDRSRVSVETHTYASSMQKKTARRPVSQSVCSLPSKPGTASAAQPTTTYVQACSESLNHCYGTPCRLLGVWEQSLKPLSGIGTLSSCLYLFRIGSRTPVQPQLLSHQIFHTSWSIVHGVFNIESASKLTGGVEYTVVQCTTRHKGTPITRLKGHKKGSHPKPQQHSGLPRSGATS